MPRGSSAVRQSPDGYQGGKRGNQHKLCSFVLGYIWELVTTALVKANAFLESSLGILLLGAETKSSAQELFDRRLSSASPGL